MARSLCFPSRLSRAQGMVKPACKLEQFQYLAFLDTVWRFVGGKLDTFTNGCLIYALITLSEGTVKETTQNERVVVVIPSYGLSGWGNGMELEHFAGKFTQSARAFANFGSYITFRYYADVIGSDECIRPY